MISRLKVFCGLCLLLAAGQLFAASSREQRAYSAAVAAFHDGIYARAEAEFGQFIDKYPDSTNAPQAVLLQAQAQIKQDKFTNAITLLTAKRSAAGPLEDQYAYWTGEAQFDAGDLDAAVQTFDSLARQFPASRLALRGTVEAAAVRAKREDWPGIVNALAETGGAFPRMAKLDPRNEDVSTGYLLLAQAELMRQDPRAALAVLTNLDVHTLKPQQNWQQLNLGEQSRLAIGDNAAALVDTTNMLQLARLEKRGDWAADAFAIRADIFEKMNRPDDAIAAYRENLAATAPVPRQRQAILEIAEISAAQKSTSAATESLEDYLRRFPDSAQADIATLAIGELELKNFAAESGPTDLLAAAHARFDAFINTFTNSPLLGNALLDRGWCFWLEGNTPQSLADFQAAVQKLSPSTELAVAKFKVGDDLFLQRDFEGARENYRAVLALTNFPAVSRTLADRALYQELRASLELKDQRGAMQALVPLLRHYPSSELLHPAEILYGEGLSDSFGKPEQARITFETFEQQYPNSPEEPQVELAIAHTFELQQDWTNAVARYQAWLERFPDNDLRSRVAYSLGLADFHAGAESNAVVVFTNFLTQFPTSEYAPLAQWWIADHYFRAAEWVGAETNYERVYQLWPTADVNL
ncbi:MAG TPA: tetratricopeptide repeat protein, partial [Verrucomicrobiae bacterium]|nr:tetratricopeptide repeat protein [Verrucomicrobiae bacterium]